ncbi:MAG: 4Fe-4S dicluster domain-containing protein, partial [Spirochaetia bacterium]|nr:4Fe-4S dicluster domain-containing protein [Spirochaetia bacterium]
PEQVLVPASSEYGISGIMQPTMKFNEGSCDYECNICGQVCPTQAIRPLPLKEKQKVQAGFAVFNQADCIIVKDNVKCKNCVSHCPTKAIKLQDTGGKILPVIDKDKCIGCGACEYYCPAKPLSAIYVDGYDVQKKLKS